MNVRPLIAAVAMVAATGSAMASEYVDHTAGFVSTATRAEVASELRQARAAGTLDFTEFNYPVVQQASHTEKSRQEVRAELEQRLRDSANGTVNSIYFG